MQHIIIVINITAISKPIKGYKNNNDFDKFLLHLQLHA